MALKESQLMPRRCDDARDPRVFGYLRVHDTDLDPDAQETALGTFDVLYIDATATFQHAQPALNILMAKAKRGDIVKVATIDRLGLTIADAIETVRLLAGMGIEAAKSLMSKKVKLIKVVVKAGYQVLLYDEKQKNLKKK